MLMLCVKNELTSAMLRIGGHLRTYNEFANIVDRVLRVDNFSKQVKNPFLRCYNMLQVFADFHTRRPLREKLSPLYQMNRDVNVIYKRARECAFRRTCIERIGNHITRLVSVRLRAQNTSTL